MSYGSPSLSASLRKTYTVRSNGQHIIQDAKDELKIYKYASRGTARDFGKLQTLLQYGPKM